VTGEGGSTILVRLKEQERPVAGEIGAGVSATVPAKPFTWETTICARPVCPDRTVTDAMGAARAKSLIMKVIGIECESAPLVPVTVTV
jgi:hypothetical protein